MRAHLGDYERLDRKLKIALIALSSLHQELKKGQTTF